MAIEIHIKVYNPSPYSELSESLDKDQIFTYCNDYYDLIALARTCFLPKTRTRLPLDHKLSF